MTDAGSMDGSTSDTGGGGDSATGLDEICNNGRDDDGDGEVDEQCTCSAPSEQECYGGPAALAGVGACVMGSQTCEAPFEFGSWTPCVGWVAPSEEICDGLDNNCDGTADEGCGCETGATRSCYSGPVGSEGVGDLWTR